MGFFENLGNIKADIQLPLIERQLQSKLNLQKQQRANALDEAQALIKQRSQAQNPQTPLRPQTFTGADQFKLSQQLNLAGIDESDIARAAKYRAEAKQAQLRTQGLQQALEGVESPYAKANIANKLDVSPVRMSGETAYNRFDPNNWLAGITPKGQAQAQSAQLKAQEENFNLEVMARVMQDPQIPFSKKLDYINKKELSESERVAVTGQDGKKVYATRYWTPSGTVIQKDTDAESGATVAIPADNQTFADQAKIDSLIAANYDPDEAARIVLGKDKSNQVIYGEIAKTNQAGSQYAAPIEDPFELILKNITDYRRRRPGQTLPPNIVQSIKLEKLPQEQEKELLNLVENTNTVARLANSQATEQAEKQLEQKSALEEEAKKKLRQPRINQKPASQPVTTQPSKPLTPEVMDSAYQAAKAGAKPVQIRTRLEENGFDMSQETIGRMAIDAINQGADPKQVAQRFQAMGYDLGALGL